MVIVLLLRFQCCVRTVLVWLDTLRNLLESCSSLLEMLLVIAEENNMMSAINRVVSYIWGVNATLDRGTSNSGFGI